ncbi:MAG: MFS transporter [Deltaproteobacteria bacterium]|nr:MAG: MFS transporter [Deltaproteobacteria bacterium]
MNNHRLSARQLINYGFPAFGMSIMLVAQTVYLPIYYTDTLMLGAHLLSIVFLVGRFWDAITDPVMGHISDRTRTRWGRRRPYFLLSSLPLAVAFFLIWSPRASSPLGLFLHLLIMYLILYTFWTIFAIPYISLGAELSPDYHERTRLFGARQIFGLVGAIIGTLLFDFVRFIDDTKTGYSLMAGSTGLLTMILILIMFKGVRENPEFQSRESIGFFAGLKITFRNRAFLILLIVFLLLLAGGSFLYPLTPYIAKYVVRDPKLVRYVVLCYIVGAALSVALWVRLARKIGKNNTLTISMLVAATAFLLAFTYHEGTWLRWLILAMIAGTGLGCSLTVVPSIAADVIDSDELETGRRREGAFFGVWTFVEKCAVGLAVFIGISGLHLIGYEPNVEQTSSVILGMKLLYCILPGICHVAAALIFRKFPITPEVHAKIRAELDSRKTSSNSESTEVD